MPVTRPCRTAVSRPGFCGAPKWWGASKVPPGVRPAVFCERKLWLSSRFGGKKQNPQVEPFGTSSNPGEEHTTHHPFFDLLKMVGKGKETFPQMMILWWFTMVETKLKNSEETQAIWFPHLECTHLNCKNHCSWQTNCGPGAEWSSTSKLIYSNGRLTIFKCKKHESESMDINGYVDLPAIALCLLFVC